MAKLTKPKTAPIPIRLPVELLPELDRYAKEEFDSRAGLLTRIVLDWVKARRAGPSARNRRVK